MDKADAILNDKMITKNIIIKVVFLTHTKCQTQENNNRNWKTRRTKKERIKELENLEIKKLKELKNVKRIARENLERI